MSTDMMASEPESSAEPTYFPVSNAKLVVLSLCSFGLYELYWLYRNWKLEKARTREDMWPFWRAFFGPLWAYSLFSRIRERATEASVPASYSSGGLAAAFFVLNVAWRLPDPFWLISFLTFVPLLPVRTVIADINRGQAPEAWTNSRFSLANVVLVVGGGILLVLAVIGSLMPGEPS
jgi:hypothetical protein